MVKTRDPMPKLGHGEFISGFCSAGQCEGRKPKSPSGKPLKTCTQVTEPFRGRTWICVCSCHKQLDMMFEMSGMTRVVQQNPEWKPATIMPIFETLEERAVRFGVRDATPPVVRESILPGRVPATVERAYTPSPSGRAKPGQLETWIKKECDYWIADGMQGQCTPKYLAEKIAERQGIKLPSEGAINAAFTRWSEIGFALVAKKPVRFIGYTPEGVSKGLEVLKAKSGKTRKFQGDR